MTNWQPISTAPRDGTWILVFGDRYMDEHLPPFGFTRWVSETLESWEQTDRTTKKLKEIDNSEWDSSVGILPTHWQPLPDPPPQKARAAS